MADSENSRTLPANTRLNVLSYTTDFLTRLKDRHADAAEDDPALAKWLQWHEAHREFGLRCRLQQHLETQLVHTVGFPSIRIDVPGKSDPALIQDEADIEYWLKGDDMADARDKAKEALAAQIRLWNAADRMIGYTKARQAESVAIDRDFALAGELSEMPAQSITGAIAKLHVVLTLGIASPDCDEFPWPALCCLMSDLLQMQKAMQDDVAADKAVSPIFEVKALRAHQP
ncbi:MAG: hypothetical protein E6Q76_01200 [Rhizobium sp.]|nr:MAG: hypothetical protein E6Q76_01200 [Rhizobium sp.]